MTHWEIARLACYVLSAPALLYLSLHNVRARLYSYAVFYGSLALLFSWYVLEISIASTGVNTREYRVFGSPMVFAMTTALMLIVAGLWRAERRRHG